MEIEKIEKGKILVANLREAEENFAKWQAAIRVVDDRVWIAIGEREFMYMKMSPIASAFIIDFMVRHSQIKVEEARKELEDL